MKVFTSKIALVVLGYLASVAKADEGESNDARKYENAIKFKRPFSAMDPDVYGDILSSFKKCTKQCQPTYSYCNDPWEAFGVLGAYTACNTACISSEILSAITYYKSTYAKLYDIGVNHLRIAKQYIAGDCDFDMIGNRTKVDKSCCVPDKYFVDWEKVTVEAPIIFIDRSLIGSVFYGPINDMFNLIRDTASFGSTTVTTQYITESNLKTWRDGGAAIAAFLGQYLGFGSNGLARVRAQYYLDYCSKEYRFSNERYDYNYISDSGNGDGGLAFFCDPFSLIYLRELKANLGQVVLHPDSKQRLPDGACNCDNDKRYKLKPNPRAAPLGSEACVVYKTKLTGKRDSSDSVEWVDSDDAYSYVTEFIAVPPNDKGKCPPPSIGKEPGGKTITLYFKKVKTEDCDYFHITGLPHSNDGKCGMNGVLSSLFLTYSVNDYFCLADYEQSNVYNDKNEKYDKGAVEYCNAKQYVNHLTNELFNTNKCFLYSKKDSNPDLKEYFVEKQYTLACLYRIVSLKCDCMHAVVTCYQNEAAFTSPIGKTLGRAASILCGFILCQKEHVYRLFGDQSGVSHTTIMKEVLLQSGAIEMQSSIVYASIAFVSMGLGMIAFFSVKKLRPVVQPSKMEDGYRHLI